MATDGTAGTQGELLGVTAKLLAAWLGVLLPIAMLIQMGYLAAALAKLPQIVVAMIALIIVAMITLSFWAAMGLWQGTPDARQRVDRALLLGFAANVFCCAPLSIFMSTPPFFLPIILITLIAMAMVDTADT